MTCLFHPEPSPTCMACVGHWDRALAERLARGDGPTRSVCLALRAALVEMDELAVARNEDRTEWMTTYATMRAEIEALRCGDVGAFHDGELDGGNPNGPRTTAFREHLGRCERCQVNLQDITIIDAIATSPPREPTNG